MKTKPYIPASYQAGKKQIQSDNLRFVVVTVRYIVAFFSWYSFAAAVTDGSTLFAPLALWRDDESAGKITPVVDPLKAIPYSL